MQTEIISRVAEIIRNPVAAKKKDKSVEKPNEDRVELSANATAWLKKTEGLSSELEKEQALKVEALKEKVQSGQYQMSSHLVDQIAERIVALF